MRKMFTITATITTAVAAVACATSSRMPSDTPGPITGQVTGSVAPRATSQWTTVLSSESGSSVKGGASASTSVSGESKAQISISGATAGDMHPWHIHVGHCGTNGPILGPAAAYPVLTVGDDGTATVSTSIPVMMAAGTDYYVNVHKSATDMGTIVACGNMTMTGM